jgi:DNA-binding transcriptional LysR family regulator
MQNSSATLQSLNWDDLRLLLQVARHASFLDAGRALGVATTTVSRRIAALEASVGARLVNRTYAGIALTPTGRRLVEELEPLAMGLEASVRSSVGGDSQIGGVVKLSVVEGLVPLTLEAIQAFRDRHPAVSFELDASHRQLDISNNEADIALRMLRPASQGLVVRRIGEIHFGVYASQQRMPTPSSGGVTALLARSDAVLLGGEMQGLKETRWLRSMARAVSLETQTLGSLIDAVRRGIGIGVIPDELVTGDASLRRLCDCTAVPQKSLWLVMNQRTAKVARVRLFAQHVTAHLRAAAAMTR